MSEKTSAVIRVEGLAKSFGDKAALTGVSLEVPAGSVVGLLGPNGAGKTTLINCLTTLLRPDAGTVRVAGHDVLTDPAAVRAQIAVTGQFAAVDEQLSARENIVFFARLLRLSRGAARERAAQLLERLDLADAADMPVQWFSGGQRRRLDLAVSLIVPRPVLVLDEPTTGLDPRSREVLWNMVRELAAAGTAILLTTQYLEEADALADRIVVVDGGRVVAAGTPAELKGQVGGSVCEVRIADTSDRDRAVDALPGSSVSDGAVVVPVRGTADLAEIVRRLDAEGVAADDIDVHRPTLNDVFLALTGPAHRDDEERAHAEVAA